MTRTELASFSTMLADLQSGTSPWGAYLSRAQSSHFRSIRGWWAATAHSRFLLLMCCVLLCLQGAARAQIQETWTNSTGDGKWSDANNWSPPTNPGGPNGNFNVYVPHTNGAGTVLDVSASIVNLTIDANAEVNIVSQLTITGSAIINNGQLDVGYNFGGTTGTLSISDIVTLSGGGNVFMGSSQAVISGGGTLINQQLIQGEGTISVALQNESPNGQITGGTLTSPLILTGNVTNSGLITGIGFTTVELQGNTVQNAGGLIDAGDSGQMLFNNCTIIGGTIGSATSVPVAAADRAALKRRTRVAMKGGASLLAPAAAPTGEPTLNGVTIKGIYSITSDSSHTNATTLEGDITNDGQIVLTSPSGEQAAVLYIPAAVSLGGSGTVAMNGQNASITGPGTVTNASPHVINGGEGSITVPDLINQSTINGPITIQVQTLDNTNGVLNAETAPIIINGGTVQNGQILANSSNSGVTLTGGVILSGVVFTGSGGGVVTVTNAVLDGLTAPDTIQLIVEINDNGVLVLEGGVIILSPGEIFLDAFQFTASLIIEESVTISGTGQMTFSNNPNNKVKGTVGKKNALTITVPMLTASGTIGDGTFPITIGAHTTVTNSGYPLIFDVGSHPFKNLGTLVETGSTIEILGKFANYNSTTNTLTGGTYMLGGILQFENANILNNAAKVILTGNGQIQNQNGANGLANFSNNTSKGTFELTGEQSFETSGTFNNEGTVIISANSFFTIGSTSTNYNQSGSTASTKVDGRLTVPVGGLANITGGTLLASSQFVGDVSVGNAAGGAAATFIVGDSKKASALVTMSNNYTQLATGIMDVQIGGTAAGTQYSQLSVTDAVTLGGTLNAALTNKFKPVSGDKFTIINAPSGVSGTFATVNLPTNFHVVYNSTSVELELQ